MQTVKAFIYPNTVEVQIPDPTIFSVRKRVVYSRPITVYQGVDNPIQMIFKNQDNKPYDLTSYLDGYHIQAEIQDPAYNVTIDAYAVVFDTADQAAAGLGTFTIIKDTVNSLDQRVYKLTFRRIDSTDPAISYPLYINDNYGASIDLLVKPAYYSIVEAAPSVDNTVIDGGIIE